MEGLSVNELFSLENTIACELFKGKKYPFEVLPEISGFIKELSKKLDKDVYQYLSFHNGIYVYNTALPIQQTNLYIFYD